MISRASLFKEANDIHPNLISLSKAKYTSIIAIRVCISMAIIKEGLKGPVNL
jgi:hypothetical protein